MPLLRPSPGPVSEDGHFGWRRLAGEQPTFHGGVDFVGALGSPIYAVKSGTVLEAAKNGVHNKYGNVVVIKHDDPSEAPLSLYAHMRSLRTRKGRRVRAGQLVGTMGNTSGTRDDPTHTVLTHLHFELLKNWPALPDVGRVDPTPFLFGRQLPLPAYASSPLLYPSYPGAPLSELGAAAVPQGLVSLAITGALLGAAGFGRPVVGALVGMGLSYLLEKR